MAREVVKLTGDEVTPVALESEGKLWILHAEEHEAIRYGESTSALIIEDERNLAEGGMLYNERR